MSEHTPGPWSVTVGPFFFDSRGESFPGVGYYGIPYATHDERLANAQLIAAAPDLLAACELSLRLCESNGYGIENGIQGKIRNAIARAKGTKEPSDA